MKALAKRGIRLGSTPDALTDATADIGAMLVLMASRRAGEAVRLVVNGKVGQTTLTVDTLLKNLGCSGLSAPGRRCSSAATRFKSPLWEFWGSARLAS